MTNMVIEVDRHDEFLVIPPLSVTFTYFSLKLSIFTLFFWYFRLLGLSTFSLGTVVCQYECRIELLSLSS